MDHGSNNNHITFRSTTGSNGDDIRSTSLDVPVVTQHIHKRRSSTTRGAADSNDHQDGTKPKHSQTRAKLGTFSGVFVPTTLNVLSILMFLRFGLILGQSGLLGMLAMLAGAYLINLVTTLSISAIATNGTVRGGGAYYLISRSLGPEFGGSIGIVFYLGLVFNTGMNAVGLVDCLKSNFGSQDGSLADFLPEGRWVEYLWATIILVLCTLISFAGSAMFARASNSLLVILLFSTLSIPFSSLVLRPFKEPNLGIHYTGYSFHTLRENLLPRFTDHPAGSQFKRESFQSLFGILFPATGGIFAGASMSGDLQHPGKAIPKGTLAGLYITFIAYTLVILSMAATIKRESFYHDVNIIQDTNISEVVILLGEFSSTFFSALMGVVGSAKLLQAIARDHIVPGISTFSQGTALTDEPVYAIVITFVVAQITMLFDINQIASFVTMAYLMTFLVTNLACFLLKISSAPNFRPSFRYFTWQTAAFGTLLSGVSMFFVDGVYASGCIGLLIVIFLLIHYTTPPKSWGDVSQSLIYHQVRKYLLRLRQEHVKFWRPQVLLLVNNPRRQYRLIQFCNSLKKGGLFVLGHVIVSDNFSETVSEARQQQIAWMKYIDLSRIKAFIDIAIAPSLEWGVRNLLMNAGLGGMRPNIMVMGMYNLDLYEQQQPLVDTLDFDESVNRSSPAHSRSLPARKESDLERTKMALPTDTNRQERDMSPQAWVRSLEDVLRGLKINVAVAKGFSQLELPLPKSDYEDSNTKKYIDLWPIQMSAEVTSQESAEKQNTLTTNFDTYTLILQLGCILNTVQRWKRAYTLRVAVFVEYESDVEDERSRLETLLTNLRIKAQVLVFWLASGQLQTYKAIIDGDYKATGIEHKIDECLAGEDWWEEIQKLRGRRGQQKPSEQLADLGKKTSMTNFLQNFKHGSKTEAVREFVRSFGRKRSNTNLAMSLPRLSMTTQRLDDEIVNRHAVYESDSDDLDDGSESDSDTDSLEPRTASRGRSMSLTTQTPTALSRPTIALPGRHSDPDVLTSRNTGLKRIPSPIKLPRQSLLSAANEEQDTESPASSALLTPISAPLRSLASTHSAKSADSRPRPSRRSSARFSSNPVPETTVSTDDGPGPSIMFAEPSRSRTSTIKHSIYDRNSTASGFPSPQSIPLSFNDLPCRGQHLILNELMQSQSENTAVVFTTLPGPEEGTAESEEDSLAYLSDLEVLLEGLPPVMLIHSNNMTVTVNI
ncbi:MAG: hypothetical protein GOMPHAMPRED_005333 [Gomphillus americanus]|uniref:Cation chloride cotransporter n=1 Tax=Gomphillus americanus TaxID=1940652 RepID=A0A8H3FQV8_9LECA|nr:MAG: hypothetical protein GOMPHAMPRED_005333 [Gomphillus americanus]